MKHLYKFARLTAIAAAMTALALTGCETEADNYDDEEPLAWQDRTSRKYSIKTPAAGEMGSITASPNPAKLGT
ncbi:MAG: hypothetical protein LBH18_02420, partial [Spirochaetaceae bacterium]|nr:hypothetical protein [Spirochaetaceae bacterium]